MNSWVTATDDTYTFYYSCTEQYPICYTNVTCFDSKSTIARVDATCGAGCAYLGWTGIELLNTYFDNTYTKILNDNQYDQAFFHEFGRNFWFYDNKLKYTSNDPIVTGYAVFMRFMAIESLGLNGAPFNGLDFNTFKNQVWHLRVTYMADSTLNWTNTLGIGQGVPSSGWGATDLFASFCFYLKENYGGMNWVQNVWKKAALRPAVNTTQDAVDNFIIASSQAANVNLVSLFKYWKWTPSASAIDYLNLTLGVSEISTNITKTIMYPNPVKDKLNFEYELKDIKIYSQEGKLIKNYNSTDSIDISNLSNGIYYVVALTMNNEQIQNKIIKE
ncbi:T9SS type A sorting domain-containing protein [Winogradskyella sp.]|uniref:T9SS type A sorting domain-containing protein n=1 Tax=Winogradskyella sp. TaxID=1883156 RepID=UPI0025ED5E5F|nr:T9SS type A sorting domain-containing protein [Winogradskyella sp.]